ncbi:pro-melanin-concentrating hormone, like [Denticeps clupeoides]|uniref:Melanin-concentrating hormone n=1 Tax=Denticeps clupeoides TaxID=299321 RepID=A0AAY4CTZ5_9TELE|nr:pro-MCH 2-like [Denticeps clupeoides]
MNLSIFSALFSVALLSGWHLTSFALPAERAEDSNSESDLLVPFLHEEMALKRDGDSKIIVVGDASLWRTLKALERGTPHLAMAENLLTAERRETSQEPNPNIAILRRDTMRCMVGRVYRPCWEV